MPNRRCTTVGFATSGLLFAGSANDNATTDSSEDPAGELSARPAGHSVPEQVQLFLGSDEGLSYPAVLVLYQYQEPGAATGMACHSPTMGTSSLSSGQECDPEVSGRPSPTGAP